MVFPLSVTISACYYNTILGKTSTLMKPHALFSLCRYTEKREKLNPHGMIHSIAKKGSRLNQRLRERVVGRDGDQEYDDFNQAARDFQAVEVLCKKLQERCEAYVVLFRGCWVASRLLWHIDKL